MPSIRLMPISGIGLILMGYGGLVLWGRDHTAAALAGTMVGFGIAVACCRDGFPPRSAHERDSGSDPEGEDTEGG